MQKQLSDEQLDQLMRTLVYDASLDEGSIKEIADSPSVWWGVQRQINKQRGSERSPWPPSVAIKRWLMIGVPSMVAAALLVAFFFMRSPVMPNEQGIAPTTGIEANISPQSIATAQPTVAVSDKVVPTSNAQFASAKPTKAIAATKQTGARNTTAVAKNRTEIKTDFISLSYSGNPESGQVVRVRVPSSMMVSLGLVSSVEKPTSLVNAEIVIGDDGQTHAIRFIR